MGVEEGYVCVGGERVNAHTEAWDNVKEELFGVVCEVTRTTPWGFREDREDIINLSVEEFLNSEGRYDTIILHILSGEGEPMPRVLECVKEAHKRAVKVVVLEHNPSHDDFKNSNLNDINPLLSFIMENNSVPKVKNWGRNLLYAYTTIHPLQLPQLSDKYYKENINNTFCEVGDHGVCQNNLVYIKTSEKPIDFELPEGPKFWIVGGGIPRETMMPQDYNYLFDISLRQCILCAGHYVDEEDLWKLERLYKFKEPLENKNDAPHWRHVKGNGVYPDVISHHGLEELMECRGATIYVSTVHKKHWAHLMKNNNIIDAWSERDTPRLLKCS